MARHPPPWLPPLRAEARFAWRLVVRHPWTRAAAAWGVGLAALARLLGDGPGAALGWRAHAAIAAAVGVAVGCRVLAPGPARAALRWSVGRAWVAVVGRALAAAGFLAAVAAGLAMPLVGTAGPAAFLAALGVGTGVGAVAAAPAALLSARVGATATATVGLTVVLAGYASAPLAGMLRAHAAATPGSGVVGATAVLLLAAAAGLAFLLGRGPRRTER